MYERLKGEEKYRAVVVGDSWNTKTAVMVCEAGMLRRHSFWPVSGWPEGFNGE